ncbi:tRNA (adenine(22)-N(1))-methyltransferase [Weissella thailandensis]|uniref:tRNA (Adenine-N(1))-methyltransferase n=1 Tax=Weissella thailandensis TaxID=89061 RepID=A0ABX9I5V2_9LACO|nr:class I SAM-dependent methyltransferase [Weissella thailandensis]NKY90513.1 tRNA (adenine-N(1))-methyltransferase [Weissella thailandensis]RDS60074.1 tRNA (adenine-N(1))-methyltransferase [Weissella thailandensis]GEP73833.1 SAM-dependent methyltransferase [Weissella thailandensis]
MDAWHLSKRLAAVADFVPDGARIADIGSDHAYLPANLLLNKHISFAIAGEVAPGPLANVENEIARHGLHDVLMPRLANGLAAIKTSDLVDTVVIAGMGGRLICQILTEGELDKFRYHRLVLQPNIDIDLVRSWLSENGYQLVDEAVVADDGHYYEILVAEPGNVTYSLRELKFGPYNLTEPSSVWLEKWQREAMRIRNIMRKLESADQSESDAYQEYAKELQTIMEAIAYASM